MHQPIPRKLIKEFLALLKGGDEAKARQFLIDHLQEFPENTRDAIIVAFFEEALMKKGEEEALLSAFREKGVAALGTLDEAKEAIEKHAKLAEIKKDIGK